MNDRPIADQEVEPAAGELLVNAAWAIHRAEARTR
ncbi:hypothetical protein JYK04_07439 [Streptomyces nojiriensis]|nr:hypothetical protein JYK04_07439 [Streptomyces nojiriensis]